jgi:hypothetical protein
LEEKVAAPVKKTEITAVRTDYATPFYQQKLALTSLTSVGRSVGIVRSLQLMLRLRMCGAIPTFTFICTFWYLIKPTVLSLLM